MRIVHVTPFYHPVIGGVEEVVKRIAEYMASKGNEVYVLTYNRLRNNKIGGLPREETISDVHVIRLRPSFIWSYGTYSNELPEIIKKLKPDLVHVHVWRHPHVFQVAKLHDKLSFKAVLHTHAPFHRFNQLGLVIWFYHKLIDRLAKGVLDKYDNLIALTPHEKSILIKKLNVKEEKINIIPNGVSDELFNQKLEEETSSTVLYLGRISRTKNIDLLITAMKHVKKEIPNVKLILAGPDEGIITALKIYAKKYRINFRYFGIVPKSEKFRLYRECRVFAHPAIYEPFGITLLEAQAFGKPCIITGNGGQLFSAPPRLTSLYTTPNPIDFGRTILLLLNDKSLYEKLSFNAKRWANQFMWSNILPKYSRIYN